MNKIKREREAKEKDIERLKWECLMRSDKFIAVWKWALAKKNNPSTPFPEQFKPKRNSEGIKITPKIIIIFIHYKLLLYMNPEKASFDEYWSLKEEWRKECCKSKEVSVLKSVEDYREIIPEDIDIVTNEIKRAEGPEPSISELKDYLINWWMRDNGYQTFLKITQRNFTLKEADEISKQIYCILKKRIPQKRLVKDEMERYLKVYDQRINKGITKKWKDVSRELYPKSDFEERRLGLLSDFKKAKRMIERVENGMLL